MPDPLAHAAYTIWNDNGALDPGSAFPPFSSRPCCGSKFGIDSAELHDPAVEFCTVRYTPLGGREEVSIWQPLKATFEPPLFRLADGSTLETKVTHEGNRTVIELQTHLETAFLNYPNDVMAAALAGAAMPAPPTFPMIDGFAIEATLRNRSTLHPLPPQAPPHEQTSSRKLHTFH